MNYTVICHLPIELKKRYLESTILCIIKPLYDLIEAENHWFAIYLDYSKEKLGIEILSYDVYLLITKTGGENFGIPRIQNNNIFNVKTEIFIKKKRDYRD